MDEDNLHPHVAEEDGVADHRLENVLVDHRVAAELDHDRLAVKLLDVGECLHQHVFAFHVVYFPFIST